MAEHHHHHHDPAEAHEDDLPQSGMDAAGASLANALRISFRILTFIIVVLCILFLLKGLFKVDPDKRALVLRFGEARQDLVMEQGLHFAFPYPIDEIIFVVVSPKQLEVNTFWSGATKLSQEDAIKRGLPPPEIVPGAEDAYMITGDMNGLQARWDISYRIQSENEAIRRYHEKIGTTDNEERLVRSVVQAAVVCEVGSTEIFDIYPSGKDRLTERVRKQLDTMFTELDCGIKIEKVNLVDIRPPVNVKDAFDDVVVATQEVGQNLDVAERSYRKILIDAGGEVGPELGNAIKSWWAARSAGKSEDMAAAEARMRELYGRAGGQARTILAGARTYKTAVVEKARGDASKIASLLADPQTDLNISLQVTHIETLQEVLRNSFENYLYRTVNGDGTRPTLDVQINRHPRILLEQTQVQDTN